MRRWPADRSSSKGPTPDVTSLTAHDVAFLELVLTEASLITFSDSGDI
jgi:hypothetical protein